MIARTNEEAERVRELLLKPEVIDRLKKRMREIDKQLDQLDRDSRVTAEQLDCPITL